MRLGIRRKLIGTLMLVGLLPLALSLVVILGGGAAMRLHSIRNTYEHKAEDSANLLAATVAQELEKLVFLSRLPQVVYYAKEQTRLQGAHRPAGAAATQPDQATQDLDRRWPSLSEQNDPTVRIILQNPLADRFRALDELDSHSRQLLATDIYGNLIAANAKTGDYFQADEAWWQLAWAEGKGRPYISSVVKNPANGTLCIELAVPIYDDADPKRVVGIVKDKLDLAWLQTALHDVATQLSATGQVVDTDTGRTVFADGDAESVRRAEEIYNGQNGQPTNSLMGVLLGDLVVGTAPVPLDKRLQPHLAGARLPNWVVIVSKPAQEAMTPVYRLAITVAAVGIALILVLFILGVAISNREIIMPILRLREATAAVGRGELNIRLLAEDQQEDATFRSDELGELARDFDDMTRQLQKNVGQLARSNEAKRRFMELAGHELRTPVTYILGVCQLTQRQLQQAQQQTPQPAGEEAAGSTTTLARGTSAIGASLGKISAKAQRLSRIIENLLKLVNNDQFTTRLIKQPIDMRALILQVCNDVRPFIAERKQQLVCDVAENLPGLEGDRDKLEDAITNLVSNAIRFSPDGTNVKVSARPVVGDMLEILVEDSGPGIPPADLANLFEPFYTGTDTLHHHSGTIEFGSKGIGLGLAIVRRFVEIHGGVVRASSTGHGTVFQVLLPLSTAREGTAEAAANLPPTPNPG